MLREPKIYNSLTIIIFSICLTFVALLAFQHNIYLINDIGIHLRSFLNIKNIIRLIPISNIK